MKEIKALSIFIFCLFLGSVLRYFVDFPIPEAIYGMIILFILLSLRFVDVKTIEEESNFLISIMGLTFVPAGVGLMNSYKILKSNLIQVVLILAISFILTLYVTGKVVEILMRRRDHV